MPLTQSSRSSQAPPTQRPPQGCTAAWSAARPCAPPEAGMPQEGREGREGRGRAEGKKELRRVCRPAATGMAEGTRTKAAPGPRRALCARQHTAGQSSAGQARHGWREAEGFRTAGRQPCICSGSQAAACAPTRTVTSDERRLPRTGMVTVAMCPSLLSATLLLYQGPALRGVPSWALNRSLLSA